MPPAVGERGNLGYSAGGPHRGRRSSYPSLVVVVLFGGLWFIPPHGSLVVLGMIRVHLVHCFLGGGLLSLVVHWLFWGFGWWYIMFVDCFGG